MERCDNCHPQRGWTSTFCDRTIAHLSADRKGKFELLSQLAVHDAASVIDVIVPFHDSVACHSGYWSILSCRQTVCPDLFMHAYANTCVGFQTLGS